MKLWSISLALLGLGVYSMVEKVWMAGKKSGFMSAPCEP